MGTTGGREKTTTGFPDLMGLTRAISPWANPVADWRTQRPAAIQFARPALVRGEIALATAAQEVVDIAVRIGGRGVEVIAGVALE